MSTLVCMYYSQTNESIISAALDLIEWEWYISEASKWNEIVIINLFQNVVKLVTTKKWVSSLVVIVCIEIDKCIW
jgi:hypothetical protein